MAQFGHLSRRWTGPLIMANGTDRWACRSGGGKVLPAGASATDKGRVSFVPIESVMAINTRPLGQGTFRHCAVAQPDTDCPGLNPLSNSLSRKFVLDNGIANSAFTVYTCSLRMSRRQGNISLPSSVIINTTYFAILRYLSNKFSRFTTINKSIT